MNIFFLDKDQIDSARYHCDKHVVKMILETAQLLCTAHHVAYERDPANTPLSNDLHLLYKKTHTNHPMAIWVRESYQNYSMAYLLFCYLCSEYTWRYKKVHKTEKKLRLILSSTPKNIPYGLTVPPLCMPDHCKIQNTGLDPWVEVVLSYRNYYNLEKNGFAKWKSREIPFWWNPGKGMVVS